MQRKKIFLTGLIIGAAVFVQGCVVAAVGSGTGTVVYIMRDLKAIEPKGIDEVYLATQKAIEALELNITEKVKDAMSAGIIIHDAQGKKITIKLNAMSQDTTKISIRVGVVGSETKSRLIYQKIREHLYAWL